MHRGSRDYNLVKKTSHWRTLDPNPTPTPFPFNSPQGKCLCTTVKSTLTHFSNRADLEKTRVSELLQHHWGNEEIAALLTVGLHTPDRGSTSEVNDIYITKVIPREARFLQYTDEITQDKRAINRIKGAKLRFLCCSSGHQGKLFTANTTREDNLRTAK